MGLRVGEAGSEVVGSRQRDLEWNAGRTACNMECDCLSGAAGQTPEPAGPIRDAWREVWYQLGPEKEGGSWPSLVWRPQDLAISKSMAEYAPQSVCPVHVGSTRSRCRWASWPGLGWPCGDGSSRGRAWHGAALRRRGCPRIKFLRRNGGSLHFLIEK